MLIDMLAGNLTAVFLPGAVTSSIRVMAFADDIEGCETVTLAITDGGADNVIVHSGEVNTTQVKVCDIIGES